MKPSTRSRSEGPITSSSSSSARAPSSPAPKGYGGKRQFKPAPRTNGKAGLSTNSSPDRFNFSVGNMENDNSPILSPATSPNGATRLKGRAATWLDQDQDPLYGKTEKQIVLLKNERAVKGRLGPRTCAEWKRALRRKYRNLVRAWRMALDTDGNGTLTYNEFGPAVRSEGYEGSIRDLWNSLDDDGGGEISLAEFDAPSADLLGRFKAFLRENFGDARTIWGTMDVRGNVTLPLKAFEEGCRVIGWDRQIKELHSILDSTLSGVACVSIQDIEWLGIPPEPPRQHPLDALRQRQAAFKAHKTNTLGAHTVEEFRKYLRRMCGNLVRAWRLKLDTDGNGVITYNEFGPAVRSLGYEGSIKELWQCLDDDDGGAITLNEIDHRTAAMLESFKVALMDQFPTAQAAWRRLAPGGQKTLTKTSFRQACTILGWKGNSDKLYKMLDSDVEICGHIGIHDFEWLGQFDTGVGDNLVPETENEDQKTKGK